MSDETLPVAAQEPATQAQDDPPPITEEEANRVAASGAVEEGDPVQKIYDAVAATSGSQTPVVPAQNVEGPPGPAESMLPETLRPQPIEQDQDGQGGGGVAASPDSEDVMNVADKSGPKPYQVLGPDGKPATTGDVQLAIDLARKLHPDRFPNNPTSVQFVNDLREWDGGQKQGATDIGNNVQLNASLYGDGKTPVDESLAHDFLQTVVHEMMHVNAGPGEKLATLIPFIHSSHDRLANAIADNLEEDFLNQRKAPKANQSQAADQSTADSGQAQSVSGPSAPGPGDYPEGNDSLDTA